MAERGEAGIGRMAEPLEIVAAIEGLLAKPSRGPLAGKRVLVTSGPTHEPIDPVRYIANRSSGKQGHAIAAAAAAAGADVTLVSGPVALARSGRREASSESKRAREMLAAVEAALPADVAVMVAARSPTGAWRRMQRAEDQERRRQGAAARADGKPRHPRHDRQAGSAAAGAGDRLCRRNRRGR